MLFVELILFLDFDEDSLGYFLNKSAKVRCFDFFCLTIKP